MTTILIFAAVFILWCLLFAVVEVIKDTHMQAKYRRDDRIMAAYLAGEAARYHAQNLARIADIRQATLEELTRVTLDAGEVIEGIAVEAEPR